ncbi:hypothetical protein Dd1591_0090 [Dickeya chrysanthemi Ech1591]|uniref:Uncharacterized protein n=1 Tax=Dickeya chrysanthemi (strain Ech1591) TaxID=561229 RepID=C6CG00_DICC1|nr:hypothetical protein [Dickeya chrysanthemi]ACT04983.1 hypothetical protein Dd1591_0090 [Dickeya chrysanthemi Ech1591]
MADPVLAPAGALIAQETGSLTVETRATPLTAGQRVLLSPWFALNRVAPDTPWFLHEPVHRDESGLHADEVIALCRRFCARHTDSALLYEYQSAPLQFRTPLLQSLLHAVPGFHHSLGIKAQGRPLAEYDLACTLLDRDGAVLYLSDPLRRISPCADAGPVVYHYCRFTRASLNPSL